MTKPRQQCRRPSTFLERCRGFHGSCEGQISMLVIFGAVAMVGLLGMVMTTGDQVSQKVQMQNTVDAAALAGGTWIARGLNATSAFNVIQTQLAGGAILLQAWQKALPMVQVVLVVQFIKFAACSILPPCALAARIVSLQYRALSLLKRIFVDPFAGPLARCGGLFWIVAKGLEWANDFIHHTFVSIALAETNDVARASGAHYAFFIPGPFFHDSSRLRVPPIMPTEKKTFEEHCNPMVFGSPRRLKRGYHPLLGFPIGKGPFGLGRERMRQKIFWLGGLPPYLSLWLYDITLEQRKNAVCHGGHCGDYRPNAYLLAPEHNGLSFLAIAYRPNRSTFFTGPRLSTPPPLYTYAQVEIYSGIDPEDPDAYTQDWRVRLAPASLLEHGTRIPGLTALASLVSRSSGPPDVSILGNPEVRKVLRQVSNH